MQVNLASRRNGRTFGLVLFFAFFQLLPSFAQAEGHSRWALGLGTGWLSDYPGAAQGRLRFLPFPVYRGSNFRIDRLSGVSGDVFNNSRLDFSWNFIFQFPTASEDIPVRTGMPDLDWVLSLGPQINYYFFRTRHSKFYFRMPMRLNTCTNFSNRTEFCGIVFNPGVRHSTWYQDIGEITLRWEMFFHSSEYQQYFFEVAPEFATPNRPAYHAEAGFLGFVYGIFHTLPFDGWSLSTALNLYDYSLAINRSSPLFLHKTNYGVFIATTIDL